MKKRSKPISGRLLRKCNLAWLIRTACREEVHAPAIPRAQTLAEAEARGMAPVHTPEPSVGGRVVFVNGGLYLTGGVSCP